MLADIYTQIVKKTILILFEVRQRALPKFESAANGALWQIFHNIMYNRDKGFHTCRPAIAN
jgi:hypothetical protein